MEPRSGGQADLWATFPFRFRGTEIWCERENKRILCNPVKVLMQDNQLTLEVNPAREIREINPTLLLTSHLRHGIETEYLFLQQELHLVHVNEPQDYELNSNTSTERKMEGSAWDEST